LLGLTAQRNSSPVVTDNLKEIYQNIYKYEWKNSLLERIWLLNINFTFLASHKQDNLIENIAKEN
jgi:hypothetical protein